MYKVLVFLCIWFAIISCENKKNTTQEDFSIRFETSGGTQTDTYEKVIQFYEALADTHTSIALYEMQETDSGKPLHLVTFNPNRSFESEFKNRNDKTVLLINNGIHPGIFS